MTVDRDEVSWGVEVIQDHLRFLAECERRFGPAQALLQFGKDFGVGTRLPIGLELGRRKECFKNATHAMLNREDIFYVEGYAMNIVDLPIPIEHAWLVDGDGTVIDPTWPNAGDHVYYGVAFKREVVARAIIATNGDAGILSDPKLSRRLCASPERFGECLVPSLTSQICRPG